MKELISNTIDSLKALHEKLDDLEKVSDQLDFAKAQLTTTSKEHHDVATALADKSLLLDSARASAAKEHDKEMYEKSQLLTQLSAKIETLRAEAAQAQVERDSAITEHQGIVASIESLKKKFA